MSHSAMLFTQLLLSVLLVRFVSATNYCDPKLCGSSKHIACNNDGRFAASCPNDAAVVDINSSLRKVILNAHNEKRNFVAGGSVPQLDPACRMGKLQWDNELANLALLNVKQCKMNHDACRKTDAFQWAGQNLAWMGYFNPLNSEKQLQDAVEMWYSEVKIVKMDYINAYPNNYDGPGIGHFTAMVTDKSTHIGCGAVTYSEPGVSYKVFLLACNYASTNIIGVPIYKSCSTAASGCTSGTDSTYNKLCTTSEPINPNDIWA